MTGSVVIRRFSALLWSGNEASFDTRTRISGPGITEPAIGILIGK